MKTSLNLKAIMGGDFGKIDTVVLTMSGLGYKGKDGDVSVYDKATKSITKVPGDFVIGDIPVYAIPSTEFKEGDLIMHRGYLKVFLGKDEDGNPKTINLQTQEFQTLVPTKNLFGYGVFSKVISPFGDFTGGLAATGDGGTNPLMMLALMGDKDDEDDDGIDPIMLMALSGGLGGNAAGGFNPLMLLALKGKL